LWQCYAYLFCIVTVLCVHVLYCGSVMLTYFVLWQCYAYMFCIVAVFCLPLLYRDSAMRTCFVSRQCYAYLFCIVAVLCVPVFLLWQCYAYLFCTVAVLCVPGLYCGSVMRTRFVLWQCYAYMFYIVALGCQKMKCNALIHGIARSTKYCDKTRTCWKSICYFASYLYDAIPSTDIWQHGEKQITRDFLWTPHSPATTKLCFLKVGCYSMYHFRQH